MLFNSIDFALFLPVVWGLYWSVFCRGVRERNIFIIAASYFFYGWWDWRFLSLIVLSSAVDYIVGLKLDKASTIAGRRRWLALSLVVNLGVLGFFKYFNFFAGSFAKAFTWLGMPFELPSLNIVLPVGISFYTFQTLSYTIDIYRRDLAPTRDPLAFFAYVSFFPQLVAGPIERAARLLPQFLVVRSFDYSNARDGLRLMLWGFFKKLVIADNCARLVNDSFSNIDTQSSAGLVLGLLFFAFQIYGDFSGYSDIAVGTARLFGFDLMRNFAYPYFSRDVAEFWRRWHISLSTWFRDYVYIPLGGSRGDPWRQVRNVLIVFSVSGLWHGANWTYFIWGLLNGLYFLPLLLSGRHRRHIDAPKGMLPSFREGAAIFATFGLITLTWVFFRAGSLSHALAYLEGIFSCRAGLPDRGALVMLSGIGFMLSLEWISRHGEIIWPFTLRSPVLRWGAYWLVALCILLFAPATPSVFLYFQF